MTAGIFVAIVGPSGAGKDTLIRDAQARLAGDPRFHFVRRYVTRPASEHEDHLTLTEAEFSDALHGGRFALAWRAHGLCYAVPRSARSAVEAGAVAVCNLSRAALADARKAFPRQATVLITAPPDVLADRLSARGRETLAEVQARIEREASRQSLSPDYTVVNDGTPQQGGQRLVDFLAPLNRELCRPLQSAG